MAVLHTINWAPSPTLPLPVVSAAGAFCATEAADCAIVVVVACSGWHRAVEAAAGAMRALIGDDGAVSLVSLFLPLSDMLAAWRRDDDVLSFVSPSLPPTQ